MKIEQWPLKKLKPYERNPRKNDHAVDQMVRQIEAFGFRVPIIAKSNGLVVDGHLRLKAAAQAKLKTVPVILADDLSAAQIRAFRIAVNRASEWAEWDMDLLKIELMELDAGGFDIELTGFDLESDFNAPRNLGSLSDQFGVPPFSVLSARDGWWQDRKRAWLALGIQSELGRGDGYDMQKHRGSGGAGDAADLQSGKSYRKRKPNAVPGGSLWPTVNPKTGKIARSNSKGKVILGTDAKRKRGDARATADG